MAISPFLNTFRNNNEFSKNIACWKTIPEKPPRLTSIPNFLSDKIVSFLKNEDITDLYSHQSEAIMATLSGENTVITTGVSSGKSLCFIIPILQKLIEDKYSKALLLFPTKALAHDQEKNIRRWIERIDPKITVNSYDGDTPSYQKKNIRDKTRILITNPDMLHMGILPHHTNWSNFFQNLYYVVIDEIHIYKGVFGSHITNVIRRLQRITGFYRSNPNFILTSATISNAKEFAEQIIEKTVVHITEDGSSQGKKHFIIYNPPVINQDLGIRKNSLLESVRIAKLLIKSRVQTIIFAVTRKSIELIVKYLQNDDEIDSNQIMGYRAGYLSSERREIESKMKTGDISAVVSTSALELGIDIGTLDASVICGYPGSIAATWQQAGRAGRTNEPSVSIFVTTANPLDQYLAQNPDYFFSSSPEKGLINPDNLLILFQHIKCCAFELPFKKNEKYGKLSSEELNEFLDVLQQSGDIHKSSDKYFWMSEKYPADQVSLRSATPEQVLLLNIKTSETIGKVDQYSSYFLAHTNAIYIHNGKTYIVNKLDLEKQLAELQEINADYYTQTTAQTSVEKINQIKTQSYMNYHKNYGDLKVTGQITGFKRIKWHTHEILDYNDLDLPPTTLITKGCWFSFTKSMIKTLKLDNNWNSDPNNYGRNWNQIRKNILERDKNTCQHCSAKGEEKRLEIHHIKPVKSFKSINQANEYSNLITLCPSCHKLAEKNVLVQSGLAGLAYLLKQIAPLHLLCDINDIGVHSDNKSAIANNNPAVIFYDFTPGGIGLSKTIFDIIEDLFLKAFEIINNCKCSHGCPSCVGASGENAHGSKKITQNILEKLLRIS